MYHASYPVGTHPEHKHLHRKLDWPKSWRVRQINWHHPLQAIQPGVENHYLCVCLTFSYIISTWWSWAIFFLLTYQQSHQQRAGRTQTIHRTRDSPLQRWLQDENSDCLVAVLTHPSIKPLVESFILFPAGLIIHHKANVQCDFANPTITEIIYQAKHYKDSLLPVCEDVLLLSVYLSL